jgi:hypothetical protein
MLMNTKNVENQYCNEPLYKYNLVPFKSNLFEFEFEFEFFFLTRRLIINFDSALCRMERGVDFVILSLLENISIFHYLNLWRWSLLIVE